MILSDLRNQSAQEVCQKRTKFLLVRQLFVMKWPIWKNWVLLRKPIPHQGGFLLKRVIVTMLTIYCRHKIKSTGSKIIKSIFAEQIYELEKIVQKSAKILSDLTNYTSIVLGPAVRENKLKKIQIVPLNKETAIAIIVTDTGHVENRMFHLPPSGCR